LFSNELQISFVDAVFESISALTTTGATVIVGLDDLPKSILFYRQFLQWLGGMGYSQSSLDYLFNLYNFLRDCLLLCRHGFI